MDIHPVTFHHFKRLRKTIHFQGQLSADYNQIDNRKGQCVSGSEREVNFQGFLSLQIL